MLKSEKMTNTREIKKNIKKYKHQTKVETLKKNVKYYGHNKRHKIIEDNNFKTLEFK